MSDQDHPQKQWRALELPSRAACKTDTRIAGYVPLLRNSPDNEVFDLIVAGLGPAALAIAISLHDSLELSGGNGLPGLQRLPRVLFLEKQSRFAWHPGMLLPEAKMQISFIKDLATLRNPRSKFTFLNYLHRNNRVAQFTNLNTFLPRREEFEDYLNWCASHFEEVARYSEQVECLLPDSAEGSQLNHLRVQSKNLKTGQTTVRYAKNVVVAIGGQPDIPQPFGSSYHQQILHSSQYAIGIEKLLQDPDGKYNVAVMGGGQSAAEIFNDLHSRFPNATTQLILRSQAMRPSDDSPFINEVFDPTRISGFFDTPAEVRKAIVSSNRTTNYGVVRIELLEEIYETLFLQRASSEDENTWRHRILKSTKLNNINFDDPSKITMNLSWDSSVTNERQQNTFDYDAIIFATGYRTNGHIQMLEPLFQKYGITTETAQVARNYQLEIPVTSKDDFAVYLQGCNEATHGLGDTLLSVLSIRAQQLIDSIFGKIQQPQELARL